MTDPIREERFVKLLDEHKRILYKVANAYCNDREDRRDLVQEMIVQLWRSFPRYDDGFRFSTWMYRIVMNVAISNLRGATRHRHEEVPIEQLDVIDFGVVDDQGLVSDDLRQLQQMVLRLDELSRALILLYLEGHSHEEIAEILGISATNVGTRINRIKKRLQNDYDRAAKALEGDDDESR